MTVLKKTSRSQLISIACVLLLAGVVLTISPRTAAAEVHFDHFCWSQTLTGKSGQTSTDECQQAFVGIMRAEAWSPQHSVCLSFQIQGQERCSGGPGERVQINALPNECYGNPECADHVWIRNNALSSSTVYGNVEWQSSSGGSGGGESPPPPGPEPEGCPRQTISSGYFAPSTGWSVWSGQYSRMFGDVNDDCKDDLVGVNTSTGNVQVGLSSGTYFGTSASWSSWSTAYSAALADVNGDGRADLVGRNSAGNVQVGLSTGGSFAASTS